MKGTKSIIKLLATCLLLTTLMSCNDNSESTQIMKTNYNVFGEISSIYYEKIENVEIKYGTKVVGQSDSNGEFNITISLDESETFSLSSLRFEHTDYVLAIAKSEGGNTSYHLIVKGNFKDAPQSWADEFYSVGGKVVYHFSNESGTIISGETVIPGTKIYLDNHLVKVIEEDGNFDLAYIVKGSVISAEYEGYHFVDMQGNPYNDIVIESDVFGLTFRAVENDA